LALWHRPSMEHGNSAQQTTIIISERYGNWA